MSEALDRMVEVMASRGTCGHEASLKKSGVTIRCDLCDAAAILDALPGLLREDSAAGEALRERLGLEWIGHPTGPRCLASKYEAKP